MGMIKVAIADDHKIFRKGVILSLRPYTNIKFVQEAENGEELLDRPAGSRTRCDPDGPPHAPKDGIETTKVDRQTIPPYSYHRADHV